MNRARLPLGAENLMSEAGASAYAWYESSVEEYLDPGHDARKRSERIEMASVVAAVLIAGGTLSATGHFVVPMICTLFYLAANWLFGRGAYAAPWPYTAGLTAFLLGWCLAPSPGAGVLAMLVALFVAWVSTRLVMYATRDSSLVAFHVSGSIAGAIALATAGGWVPLAAALAVGFSFAWLWAFRAQGKRAISPLPVRLHGTQFTQNLPDPPSRIPFLLRPKVKAFEDRGRRERARGARTPEESSIDIKKIGGAGERATALLLLGLPRRQGTRIIHDVDIPGATRGGNADHVIVGRFGAVIADSKRFGSAKDPGVVQAVSTGSIAHVSDRRAPNDLTKTLKTLAWAVRGIRNEMRLPVRGLLVIHNAGVQGGLSVIVPGEDPDGTDVTIDVIAARDLVDYFAEAPTVMTAKETSGSLWGFRAKLRSATTGRSPQMVAPIGGGPRTRVTTTREVPTA